MAENDIEMMCFPPYMFMVAVSFSRHLKTFSYLFITFHQPFDFFLFLFAKFAEACRKQTNVRKILEINLT